MLFFARSIFCSVKKRLLVEHEFKQSKDLIPLDAKIVVESWEDIVTEFNGDPYRGRSRSVPSPKEYKSAKCRTFENVSGLPYLTYVSPYWLSKFEIRTYFDILFALLVIKV